MKLTDFIGPYIYHRHMEKSENDYCARWKAQSKFSRRCFPTITGRSLSRSILSRSFAPRLPLSGGKLLQPPKPFLLKHNPVLRLGKAVVHNSIYGLEKLRIVR